MDELHSEPARLSVHHVDVFTDRAMTGNGLAVVSSAISLEPDTMLRIAQEARQFETIFLFDVGDGGAEARASTSRPRRSSASPAGPSWGRQPSCTLGSRDEQMGRTRSGPSGSAADHLPSRLPHAMAGSSGRRWTGDPPTC